jgi:hypothetical protein
MFDYLNRYHLKNKENTTLGEIAMQLFVSHFYSQVKDSLRSAVLETFKKDRNEDIIDAGLLKKIVSCYVSMGF